jgi:hypothetical protein
MYSKIISLFSQLFEGDGNHWSRIIDHNHCDLRWLCAILRKLVTCWLHRQTAEAVQCSQSNELPDRLFTGGEVGIIRVINVVLVVTG